MSNNGTYVKHVVVLHRVATTYRPPASPTRAADLALLRVALGLPADAEVRWSTCR